VIIRSTGLLELLDLLFLAFVAFLVFKTVGSRLLGTLLLGAFLGGMVGFMHRPAVPQIGRLPFDTVITRGEAVRFDETVRPNAELSFNFVVIGSLLGAAIFGFCASMTQTRSPLSTARFGWLRAASAVEMSKLLEASNAADAAGHKFCTSCGRPLGEQWAFCASCGSRRVIN